MWEIMQIVCKVVKVRRYDQESAKFNTKIIRWRMVKWKLASRRLRCVWQSGYRKVVITIIIIIASATDKNSFCYYQFIRRK